MKFNNFLFMIVVYFNLIACGSKNSDTSVTADAVIETTTYTTDQIDPSYAATQAIVSVGRPLFQKWWKMPAVGQVYLTFTVTPETGFALHDIAFLFSPIVGISPTNDNNFTSTIGGWSGTQSVIRLGYPAFNNNYYFSTSTAGVSSSNGSFKSSGLQQFLPEAAKNVAYDFQITLDKANNIFTVSGSVSGKNNFKLLYEYRPSSKNYSFSIPPNLQYLSFSNYGNKLYFTKISSVLYPVPTNSTSTTLTSEDYIKTLCKEKSQAYKFSAEGWCAVPSNGFVWNDLNNFLKCYQNGGNTDSCSWSAVQNSYASVVLPFYEYQNIQTLCSNNETISSCKTQCAKSKDWLASDPIIRQLDSDYFKCLSCLDSSTSCRLSGRLDSTLSYPGVTRLLEECDTYASQPSDCDMIKDPNATNCDSYRLTLLTNKACSDSVTRNAKTACDNSYKSIRSWSPGVSTGTEAVLKNVKVDCTPFQNAATTTEITNINNLLDTTLGEQSPKSINSCETRKNKISRCLNVMANASQGCQANIYSGALNGGLCLNRNYQAYLSQNNAVDCTKINSPSSSLGCQEVCKSCKTDSTKAGNYLQDSSCLDCKICLWKTSDGQNLTRYMIPFYTQDQIGVCTGEI